MLHGESHWRARVSVLACGAGARALSGGRASLVAHALRALGDATCDVGVVLSGVPRGKTFFQKLWRECRACLNDHGVGAKRQ